MSAPIPNDDSVIEADGIDAALFWHAHKSKILLGLVAVVLIAGGSLVWYVTSTLKTRAAIVALAGANDIPKFEEVIKEYPGSQPAADAMLLLAGAQQAEGKYAESTATFQNFIKSYPKHPLAGGALFGVGQNFDAAGNSEEAVKTYQQVVEDYPKSYAAPFAAYSQAAILLRDFRRDEARQVLNLLASQFPESPLARVAASQAAHLGPAEPATTSTAPGPQ